LDSPKKNPSKAKPKPEILSSESGQESVSPTSFKDTLSFRKVKHLKKKYAGKNIYMLKNSDSLKQI